MGGLLQPVGNGPHHDIAAQSWRVGPKKSPRRRSATLSSAKTSRRSDTWLVLSGALAAALASISGPFVATESFWSRLPAAVRPCGSAAELIGRRVKLFGLGRIWITRWPRESRRRGRPRRGRFRHAPGGRRSRDGEGRSARLVRYGATTPWRRSALPTWRPDRVGAIRSPARSSCLGGAPSLLARRCAPGRRHICCGLRFRRTLVRVLRNGRAGYGLRAALIGRDGLQSRVSQFQRIRLARFLVASPGFHSALRFDLARQASLQKLGRDLLRRGGFQGLRRDEAAILAL